MRTLLIFICFTCFQLSWTHAQIGFLKTLGIRSDEPNYSLQVKELEENIVTGG